MPRRITATNKVTGEKVSFDWDHADPPTADDISAISDQQRDSRVAYLQKTKQAEDNVPVWDRILRSKPVGAALEITKGLGLNQEWHPIQGIQEMGAGARQALTGEGTEANPRTAGAVKAVSGAMKTFGPPATAVGYALAPVPTAAAMSMGHGTSQMAQALTPEDTSPEVKQAVSLGAGLVAGGVAGHYANAMASPETIPVPPRPQPRAQATSMFMEMPPRELSEGGPQSQLPPVVPKQLGPPQVPIQTPPPTVRELPPPEQPQLPQGQPQGLLPAPGDNPIQMPPASIPMPPAGTHEAQVAQGARINYGQRTFAPTALRQLPSPSLTKPVQSPSEVSSVQPPEAQPPEVQPEVRSQVEQTPPPQVPPAAPPPAPIPPQVVPQSQVPPEAPVPPMPPPQVPAVQPQVPPAALTPEVLPPLAPKPTAADIARAALQQSKNREIGQAPPQAPIVPSQSSLPTVQAPTPIQSPQAQSPQLPPVTPPQGIAQRAMAAARTSGPLRPPGFESAEPPPSPTLIDHISTGTKDPKLQGALKKYIKSNPEWTPEDAGAHIASTLGKQPGWDQYAPEAFVEYADGIKRSLDEARARETQIVEPEPEPTPPEESDLRPTEQQKVIASNQVLDFLKRRVNVTPDHIQRELGISKDQVMPILRDFMKRGLIEAKSAGKYNYIRRPGEPPPNIPPPKETTGLGPVAPPVAPLETKASTEIGPVESPLPKPPVEETATPEIKSAEPKPAESQPTPQEDLSTLTPEVQSRVAQRTQHLSELQKLIDEETDPQFKKSMQLEHDSQTKNLQIDKSGTKTQRAILDQIDTTASQINKLEDVSDPTPDQEAELSTLYKRHQALEARRDLELKPNTERFGPRVGGLRDLHAEGQLSNLTHSDLSTRAKSEYGVTSMKDLTPEQIGDFADKLHTERLEKEARIQELEGKELDGTITPEESSWLKKFWADETGSANIGAGLRRVAELLQPKGPNQGVIRKALFQSGETTLKREGAGDLAQDILSMRTEAEKHAGQLVLDYHRNIEGMTDLEFKSFMGVIQGTGRAMNPRVLNAAQAEIARLKTVESQLGRQTTNLDPVTSTRGDKALLSDYYTDAARKIEEHTSFGDRKGKLPEDVNTAIDDIKARGGDYRSAFRIADAYFNPNRLSEAEQAIWNKLAGFEVASKLGMSVISNATQPVNVALVTGNMTLLKSLAREVNNFKDARDFALRAGSILSSVTHESQISAGVKPEGFSSKMLEYTGFSPVEVHNRIVASMAGAEHAVKMFDKLKADPTNAYARRHLLHWLGLDPDILVNQQQLTQDQILTAAHTLTDRTQFRTTPMEVPPTWGSSLPMKMITLFKNFAFNQARFMKQVTLGEMAKGNFRPLIPLLTTLPIIGTLADRLKRGIMGKEDPKTFWDAVYNAYSAVGGFGIISDLAARAAVGKLANAVVGPVAGDAVDLVESFFKGTKQNPQKGTEKFLTRQIPVIGRPLAEGAFPVEKRSGANP